MGNGREEANERWSIDFIFYTKIIPFKKRKEKEINTIAKKTFRIGDRLGQRSSPLRRTDSKIVFRLPSRKDLKAKSLGRSV